MKRTLSLLLALVLLLPALSSCATELHEHDFKMTQDVAPTCDTEGYKAYLCDCGEQKIEKFPALGHDFEELQSTTPTCEDFGVVKKVCKNCGLETTTTEEPLGHEWDGDPEDYVSLHTCARCGERKAFDSPDPFSERFETGYTEGMESEAQQLVENIKAFLEAADGSAEDLCGMYDDLEVQCDLLAKARDRADAITYLDESKTDEFLKIGGLLEDLFVKRRELYVLTYNSDYRDAVFADWDPEELEDYIHSCEAKSDPEYARLVARADEISNAVIQLAMNDPSVPSMLAELVGINNQIAKYNGYANYYEYAYPELYGRAYGAEQTDRYSDYVEEYVVPYYNKLLAEYEELQKNPALDRVSEKGAQLTDTDLFESEFARDAFAAYLKEMNVDGIDMFELINDLFRDGRILFGNAEAAFTAADLPDDPYVYFKHHEYYSSLFTVCHEFGHYTYFAVQPELTGLDYDLAETHSQGNEMLLLAFLREWLPAQAKTDEERADIEYMFELTRMHQELSFLKSVIRSERVDYFEYLLYTGKIKTQDYAAYIAEHFPADTSANYLIYVATYSPCYYISYSVSALPSLRLYDMACEDFDAAKEAYFKLMTYPDAIGETYELDGFLYSTATYEEILNYSGIGSPFEKSFYEPFME